MSWIHLINGLWKLSPVLLSFILLFATSTSVVETIIFFGSLSALLPKLSLFIEKFAQVQDSLITYNKVLTFLNTEYPENKHSKFAPSITSEINIQDLTFTYPNSDDAVISNVNLSLKKGEIICIVGENGSGKSTLVHLILGLYDPSQGSIMYDEQCFVPSSSVFFQNFLKLESTIRDNVSFGNPKEDTDEYILQKLKDANADFAIEAGLDCSLDPQFGGRNLSGGQWQRLALARTFLQQNGIIVLDEPTASLDPVAEIELYTTVLKKYKDRTILFVSHRLTASILADQIWVMDEGRLVETGTHDELVKQKGEYNKLFTAQAQPYLEYYQKTTIGG
ncbi:hypothetical protein PA598K_03662 [Paenibacillus sp. 598K]|nr:hypothetical protein PA598K_03662 [Paenibacillus sp. 598K]